MKEILIVAGTRPEIIKIAPVLLAARDGKYGSLRVRLCLTGQHQTMATEALAMFGLEPETSLDIMQPNQTLNGIARSVFEKLPPVLERLKPAVIMVQGDTTTAAMAGLCAFNLRIPVAHIEAGLRSFNLNAPYPEELNRKVISALARFNFCPTPSARDNMKREGVSEETLYVTGNTVVDALQFIIQNNDLDNLPGVHNQIKPPFVLITAHRRESFGEGFQNICFAIRECAERFPGMQFVYPVHLNPNVQAPVQKLLGNLKNVLLIPPIPYLPLLTLLKNCAIVLTDSGGIQEEAPSFGKYCVVMRDVTERMESVQKGFSELVGTDKKRIVSAVSARLAADTSLPGTDNPYGDGRAAERILSVLVNHIDVVQAAKMD